MATLNATRKTSHCSMKTEPRGQRVYKGLMIKTLYDETNVISVPDLPKEQRKTTVVVDGMRVVRRWSFHSDETFGAIARRYNDFINCIPAGTISYTFAVVVTIPKASNHPCSSTCMPGHGQQGCSRQVSNLELLTHRSFSPCRPTRRDF